MKLVAYFVLWTTVFALAYCQAPLYFSNQNQYFVHGLADGGHGYLEQDWLANTKDPTPIFTFVVATTYRYFHVNLFYVFYALLMGIYFCSLVRLFTRMAQERATPLVSISFIALFLFLHSGALRLASTRLLGTDYPWYFQAGVAGQYVLGPIFQPSAFGTLLILSVVLFAYNKPYLAVISSALGAVAHATYLLPAAILTTAYMVALCFERQFRRATLVGLLALAIVLPIVVYNLLNFSPTSAENFAKAQEILVHFRIPHHAIPRLWCDEIAMAQTAWVLLGIFLVRGRLFIVLLITFLLSALLSGIQITTDSHLLALLFPWRMSVILVPIATTIILTRAVLVLGMWLQHPPTWRIVAGWIANIALIAGCVACGMAIMYFELAFQTRDEELRMMDHVYRNSQADDIYAIPVNIPDLEKEVHGAQKSDFKPLPTLRKNEQFIPLNLQRFRLFAGVPIFVDFKSIPYWDRDVLEWRERLNVNRQWYTDLKEGRDIEAAKSLRKSNVTHIVVRVPRTAEGEVTDAIFPDASLFELFYEDGYYRVYRLK